MLILKTRDGEYQCNIKITEYVSNNTLAILLIDANDYYPVCNLTVNIDGSHQLPKDCAFVDTNNLPEAEDFIKENKLGEPLGVYGQSGYCTYPAYEFNIKELSKYEV